MPKWLLKQLNQAFKIQDRKQIKYLNESWLSFQKKLKEDTSSTKKISSTNI